MLDRKSIKFQTETLPKLLMQGNVTGFPLLDERIRKDLEKLPVIVYPKRKDVIAYLGTRHIIGVSKWDAYAKARYVASMKDEYGLSLDEIQKTVGDTSNSARKTYISYKLIETVKAENEDYDTSKAKENFSYIMLAFGQSAIKEYVGLAKQWTAVDVDNPIQVDKMKNLLNVFSWLFGEGKEKSKVIEESRDITAKLSPVLRNATATQYLIEHRDLKEAYERCDGEADLLIKYIKRASRDLGKALPLATNPAYINSEVKASLDSCERIFVSLKQLTS